MEVHLTQAFPVSASRLWDVAVTRYADSEVWDRSVHSSSIVPDGTQIDGVEHSRIAFDTSFGHLTVQILDVRREGVGGVMVYTIAEGLPSVIREGSSTWTITSDGPDRSVLTVDVVLTTTPMGTLVSPVMKAMFRRGDKQMIADLHAYLVTGEPSAAKRKAVAKHG